MTRSRLQTETLHAWGEQIQEVEKSGLQDIAKWMKDELGRDDRTCCNRPEDTTGGSLPPVVPAEDIGENVPLIKTGGGTSTVRVSCVSVAFTTEIQRPMKDFTAA